MSSTNFEKYGFTNEQDTKSDSDEAPYIADGGLGAGAPAGYAGQKSLDVDVLS
jgi:hypothetical protein